jgi:phosphohistidine phosphatase
MELYLIRHGIAIERQLPQDDSQRPLTNEGQAKTEKMAQKLVAIGLKFNLILTSPLVRAQQTAKILNKAGLSEKITEFDGLKPDGELETWLNWWAKSGYNNKEDRLALVGHQPDLGNWAEILVWGSTQEKLIVKKAGVIGVRLPETINAIGNSELFLLTSPKWLI